MSPGHASHGRLALAVAVSALAFSATAASTHPPEPTSPNQPARDGCQRSSIPIGLNRSPQWVYVYRSRRIRAARGVTRIAHAAVDDSQFMHDWFDFNANLVVKRKYRYLLGGSRARHTGNFTAEGAGGREEIGRLHYEWQRGTLPFFAWPTDGDRTTIWGSWIWDCGHWGNEYNTGHPITGEHTELHPLNG